MPDFAAHPHNSPLALRVPSCYNFLNAHANAGHPHHLMLEDSSMPASTAEQIHALLKRIPDQGLDAVKSLFCTELNYDYTNAPLSHRDWPDGARNALAEPPVLLAQHASDGGAFDVIYARLGADQRGRGSPLSITAERLVVNQMLKNHPYALFVFSDAEQRHWHLVNVRYDTDTRKRRIFRRIAIGPHERLRTAAERVAMLDIASMPKDWFGLSPLAIQRRHDEAFNVEAVTDEFFKGYQRVFRQLQQDLYQQTQDARWAHDFALQFLNRLMFLYYVQRKHWLGDDPDFIANFWRAYQNASAPKDTFVSDWLNVLFFEAFNNKFQAGRSDRQYLPPDIRYALAMAPYLNGGLFERNRLDDAYSPLITDDQFRDIFTFMEGYNFTISEDTPLDQEVAVDPEMIGKVYESLVNVSEEVDERGQAGIFYTPQVEIDLMCRLALVDYLANHLGAECRPLLYETVFAFEPQEKEEADAHVAERNLWPRLNDLLRSVTVVDPACGSGSFLVGMLYVLDDLLARAGRQLGTEETPYERKKRIIRDSLYGVDIMDWAVHVAELRLWLQLVIDTDLAPAELKFRPLLPNLSFKIRPGDSLVQQIGAINLAVRKGSQTIPPVLQGKLTRLKAEKLKFYNGEPDREYRSEEALRHAELQIFREILEARLKAIADRISQIEDGLKPQTNLFGEIQSPQMRLDRVQLEQERDRLLLEEKQVSAAREALETIRDIPFVWDIAFVEVFEGERRGFDIVIGNPPYVRQERIRDPRQSPEEVTAEQKKAYKEKLMRSVYAAWPRTFGWGKERLAWTLDAKSDLYIYFYFHGLSLLNDKGAFCFITSNSWLDVGYGRDLQEFLLTRGQVRLVIDNQARRSFAQADVNTVIVLLGAPQDSPSPRDESLNHTARFVMLTVPFEDVLNPVVWLEVDEAKARRATPEYRVHPAKQSALRAAGMDPEKKAYAGDKWGGKYLRAPDIYWVILEKGKGKLVRLGDIAEVRRGFTTGANEFFYLDEARIRQWGIEEEFLRPVVKSPRDYYSITIPQEPIWYLLWCQAPKNALKGKNVLAYLEWGEQQGYNKRPSCAGRNPWYAVHGPTSPAMLWPSSFFERYICYECPLGFVADKVFYTISGQNLPPATRAFLNSSVAALLVEVEGYQLNHGGIFVTAEWLANMPVLNAGDPALHCAYDALTRREVLLYENEVRQSSRIALDAAVLKAIGLPESDLPNLYETVGHYIRSRITKARRRLTQKGRETSAA